MKLPRVSNMIVLTGRPGGSAVLVVLALLVIMELLILCNTRVLDNLGSELRLLEARQQQKFVPAAPAQGAPGAARRTAPRP